MQASCRRENERISWPCPVGNTRDKCQVAEFFHSHAGEMTPRFALCQGEMDRLFSLYELPCDGSNLFASDFYALQ